MVLNWGHRRGWNRDWGRWRWRAVIGHGRWRNNRVWQWDHRVWQVIGAWDSPTPSVDHSCFPRSHPPPPPPHPGFLLPTSLLDWLWRWLLASDYWRFSLSLSITCFFWLWFFRFGAFFYVHREDFCVPVRKKLEPLI